MTASFRRYGQLLLLTLFLSFSVVSLGSAQTSGGIATCGQGYDYANACKTSDVSQLVSRGLDILFRYVIFMAVFLGLAFVGVKLIIASNKAQALAEAKGMLISMAIGFGLIVIVLNARAVLEMFGVREEVLKWLPSGRQSSLDLVSHAYAQEVSNLSPIKDISFTEFVRRVVQVVSRLVIMPIVIICYVWTGFLFVYARGKPDMLMKAKSALLFTLIGTFILFIAEAVGYALQATLPNL